MNRKKMLCLVLAAFSGWSCLQLRSFIDPSSIDVKPPSLLEVEVQSPRTFVLHFSEEIVISGELSIPGHLAPLSSRTEGTALIMDFEHPARPGEEIWVSGFVRDSHGNETAFTIPGYGYNDRIPAMIINEFTTNGSAAHPDFVEIRILEGGNCGGVCIFDGVPGNYISRFIFPDCELAAEEYIVVHFKPQGITEEINETDAIDISGGLDAFEYSRDFWVSGSTGLSGNNGVISLYTQASGTLVDGVLYSNRTSQSDTKYRGFGSVSTMERADRLAADGGWVIQEQQIRPEDGINPEKSTATRSINRKSSGLDENSRDDWHIVPTSQYSPGRTNSDEVYR